MPEVEGVMVMAPRCLSVLKPSLEPQAKSAGITRFNKIPDESELRSWYNFYKFFDWRG